MKNTETAPVTIALRNLLDFELEAAGWTTGKIREVRRYLAMAARTRTAYQRQLCAKYQTLRREIIANEEKVAARDKCYTVYTLDILSEIPDPAVAAAALELATLWERTDAADVPFPGVCVGVDRHNPNRDLNYYVHGALLATDTPPMHRNNGGLTAPTPHHGPGHPYKYGSVTVRTALSRAKSGKDLFAWGVER